MLLILTNKIIIINCIKLYGSISNVKLLISMPFYIYNGEIDNK